MLAVLHRLTAVLCHGILRAAPFGRSRAGRLGPWFAIVGNLLLAGCELWSGAIVKEAADSPVAGLVGTAFGVASLVTIVGELIAGVAIVRAKVWQGLPAWMLLTSALVLLLLVTPANISGSNAFRMIALGLWSLTFIPLGIRLMRPFATG